MLYQIVIIIHILLGMGIIGLVLMQHGKGADAGAAFGSGSSGTVFGAQGSASFLSRTTAVFAALFFTTSLVLAIISGYQGKKADLIDTISTEASQPAVVSDVPLNPAGSAATSAPVELVKPAAPAANADAIVEENVPAAPAIKEVEKAPAAN